MIEVSTGNVVGDARWLLPPALGGKHVWPGVQVAEANPEDLEVIKRKAEIPSPELRGGKLHRIRDIPLDAADARIMRNGPYLGKYC